MDADPAEHHHVDNDAESGSVPGERMAVPRPAPDIDPENLPDTIPDADDDGEAEWWYDQRGKRGKHYRYTGRVKRISGSAGQKIRAELAATIYNLLVWAKDQQTDTGSSEGAREDGRADDNPE